MKEIIPKEQIISITNLEIETYYYDEREYLKRKYYNLSNIETNLFKRTFKNSTTVNDSDKANKESFERYCANFNKCRKDGLGILMMGGRGTGKSYYSDCIYNKLSKDNWNEYNILLAEGTEEEVQAFLKDCFDNVFEDFEHITDTEIVDRPNYVGTDFWIEEIRIEELMTDMEKNLIRKLKRKYK